MHRSRNLNLFLAFIFVFLSLCFYNVVAQSTAGISNQPDTSFSIYSDYVKHRKKHPEIATVEKFQLKSVKEESNVTYCTVGERKLLLDVFYPTQKSKGRRPSIMIIHGGGWRSGNKNQHHPLAQRLSDLGYVTFTPEYRLSTEALYPAAIHDLKAGLRWIHTNAKKYNIDPSKIAVLGFSAGGQLAALLGTTIGNPHFEGNYCNTKSLSTVNAIVDLDGTLSFVHPESGEGDDSKKPSAATLWFGYSKKENLQLWEDASPLKYVSKNTPPTLFINSSVDRMHAGRDDFMKVLRENDIYTDVKTFEEAPHSFPLFHPWFEPTVKYIDEFLKAVNSNPIKSNPPGNANY